MALSAILGFGPCSLLGANRSYPSSVLLQPSWHLLSLVTVSAHWGADKTKADIYWSSVFWYSPWRFQLFPSQRSGFLVSTEPSPCPLFFTIVCVYVCALPTTNMTFMDSFRGTPAAAAIELSTGKVTAIAASEDCRSRPFLKQTAAESKGPAVSSLLSEQQEL